jgi:hypothetical protein
LLGAAIVDYLGEELVDIAVLQTLTGDTAADECYESDSKVEKPKKDGSSLTITCTDEVASWIDHLHRAHSIDELEHLQVIIGQPLPAFPHLTHSPEPVDLPAAAIHYVATPAMAEETVLELYSEEVALAELAVALHEITHEGRLPRQEVAG